MRLAQLNGRVGADTGAGFADVERSSGGLYPSSAQAVYDECPAFRGWAEGAGLEGEPELDPAALRRRVPQHRQVFAVAHDYRERAAEGGYTAPETPLILTKYPTCLAGARAEVA